MERVNYVAVIGSVSIDNKRLFNKASVKHSAEFFYFENPEKLRKVSFPSRPVVFWIGKFTSSDFYNVLSSLPLNKYSYCPIVQFYKGNIDPELSIDADLFFKFDTVTETNLFNVFNVSKKFGSISEVMTTMNENIDKYRGQYSKILEFATSISTYHDSETLFEFLLFKTMEFVGADAGSIYVRERDAKNSRFLDRLRFMTSLNKSIELPKTDHFTVEIDNKSMAGSSAFNSKVINVDDVYNIGPESTYGFNKNFDLKLGYRTKSMLTVPLTNIAGEVVGIVQLINKTTSYRTERKIISFSFNDELFLKAIASLAGVSIERTMLYEEIDNVFSGLIASSVASIDERDKVTFGHSERVMKYAICFAEAISSSLKSPFETEHFSKKRLKQFKYASLLHDIGKIGVPEAVLNKESKVAEVELETIFSRLEMALVSLDRGEKLFWKSRDEIFSDMVLLEKINKSGFISEDEQERLSAIFKNGFYYNYFGDRKKVLTDSEFEALSVPNGNLTKEERSIMNSHALSTYNILSKIPWNAQFRYIPDIAAHHHEKMDGSGYPHAYKGNEIMLESRILAIVDIYDALTAQDRPYKPSMSVEKALSVLKLEADANHLDKDLVEFFIRNKIFEKANCDDV